MMQSVVLNDLKFIEFDDEDYVIVEGDHSIHHGENTRDDDDCSYVYCDYDNDMKSVVSVNTCYDGHEDTIIHEYNENKKNSDIHYSGFISDGRDDDGGFLLEESGTSGTESIQKLLDDAHEAALLATAISFVSNIDSDEHENPVETKDTSTTGPTTAAFISDSIKIHETSDLKDGDDGYNEKYESDQEPDSALECSVGSIGSTSKSVSLKELSSSQEEENEDQNKNTADDDALNSGDAESREESPDLSSSFQTFPLLSMMEPQPIMTGGGGGGGSSQTSSSTLILEPMTSIFSRISNKKRRKKAKLLKKANAVAAAAVALVERGIPLKTTTIKATEQHHTNKTTPPSSSQKKKQPALSRYYKKRVAKVAAVVCATESLAFYEKGVVQGNNTVQ